MREWIPIPGTNKQKIVNVALKEFSAKGFNEVNIAELAKMADVTTGAIYHHFGSKLKLYEIIRAEMEQRIIDRMEGAASLFELPNKKLEVAFIIGLEFAIKLNICRLISEEIPNVTPNKIESFFIEMNDNTIPGLEIVLLSSWRSILKAVGVNQINADQGKDLIKWMFDKKA